MRKYKYHIVLSFVDNAQTFYVVKYFGIHKQWWHYEIWNKYDLASYTQRGYNIVGLKAKKEDKK